MRGVSESGEKKGGTHLGESEDRNPHCEERVEDRHVGDAHDEVEVESIPDWRRFTRIERHVAGRKEREFLEGGGVRNGSRGGLFDAVIQERREEGVAGKHDN